MEFRVTRLQAIAEAHERCANPWCRSPATDVHHILHRHESGTDHVTNLILLCRNCHVLYHFGLVGRRTVIGWKHAVASGQTHELGIYLDNWPSLPAPVRRKLREALRSGNLASLIAICSGIFWRTEEPEWIALYGFPLANAFRQRGRYPECMRVTARLEQAIDAMTLSRGAAFGLGMQARLAILKARIKRGLGSFGRALPHFDRAISIATTDQYPGWQQDTLQARVDQISIRTRLVGTTGEDLAEIARLRDEISYAHQRHLIRSSVPVAAFLGDLAVVEARFEARASNAKAVLAVMRPAIETLRSTRYPRGFGLRLLNLADMLRTMLPKRPKRRDSLVDEIRDCFQSAARAVTNGGRIALEDSVIGASANHMRGTLLLFDQRRYHELDLEDFR